MCMWIRYLWIYTYMSIYVCANIFHVSMNKYMLESTYVSMKVCMLHACEEMVKNVCQWVHENVCKYVYEHVCDYTCEWVCEQLGDWTYEYMNVTGYVSISFSYYHM